MPGVTRCHNPATGGDAELPTDSLAAWVGRGWEPAGESRSLEEAEAERAAAENAAAVVKAAATDLPLTPAEQDHPEPAAAAAADLGVEQSQEDTNPAGDAGTPKEN